MFLSKLYFTWVALNSVTLSSKKTSCLKVKVQVNPSSLTSQSVARDGVKSSAPAPDPGSISTRVQPVF